MSERPPSPMIVYEQPLSERIRAFMRLEFLFARARHLLEQDDAWASRGVVETINDVMAVLGRSDLKKELVKELERQAGTLENLARNPQVDEARLGAVLARVRDSWSRLRTSESALGQELRDIELLSAVRQRSSIPAGSCGFDLPAYHQWLRRPVAERQQDLLDWLAVFDDLGESIELCLSLIRQSAVATHEVAGAGFFQRNLETTPMPDASGGDSPRIGVVPRDQRRQAPLHHPLHDSGSRRQPRHSDRRGRRVRPALLHDLRAPRPPPGARPTRLKSAASPPSPHSRGSRPTQPRKP